MCVCIYIYIYIYIYILNNLYLWKSLSFYFKDMEKKKIIYFSLEYAFLKKKYPKGI